jgi:hypothetical protein
MMRRERNYRDLASALLQVATGPSRMTEWGEGRSNASHGEERRVVVGKIVDCNQMFFLTEESSPHAYILSNIARVKTLLGKTLLGRKVRVTGALQSPHALAVETIDELH